MLSSNGLICLGLATGGSSPCRDLAGSYKTLLKLFIKRLDLYVSAFTVQFLNCICLFYKNQKISSAWLEY